MLEFKEATTVTELEKILDTLYYSDCTGIFDTKSALIFLYRFGFLDRTKIEIDENTDLTNIGL